MLDLSSVVYVYALKGALRSLLRAIRITSASLECPRCVLAFVLNFFWGV